MTLKYIVTLAFLVFGMFNAMAQKQTAFNYPDDIVDSARKQFSEDFKKGLILYKINCARCHNKLVNGKEIIPNFSLPQLMDYEIRIFPEHNEKLTDNKVADEELAKIILFLRYRQKKAGN